jgi:hypothetical protein
MPRDVISDAHEWINEIPTVPMKNLAKPQLRDQRSPMDRQKTSGQKDIRAKGLPPSVPIIF